ncbi:NADP-dependent leukotriene B4 12-hydroxydehydrogenase [Zalerion maritima]|uniref:Dehydrogenase FUB6 n=1 Tax=Zalerion maritima TaxID=339359 RepID=A0AAD5RSP8_9PEZI|nr:NADP-dependent leukotriene B4 12-hydroxydehydrogenase [Zalerion maritima]
MSQRTNTSLVLAERPKGSIVPGKTFAQKSGPAPTEADLKDGQVLAESLYLSLDPAMRGWLNDARSYLPPVQIGDVMRGAAIVRVLASKSKKAKKGDIVHGFIGWQEVGILGEEAFDDPFDIPANCNYTDLLGVLGSTGLTAYFGLLRIGEPKKGDTVVVSGAAGATGSVVGQIAKIMGCRVVGIAGGDDKCRWLKEELGFDEAVNYKDPDFKEKFKQATPEYIDVFFDNVGGEILEAALARAKMFARFVMCGAISQYNSTTPQGPKNYFNIIAMRIKVQGFIVFDFRKDYGEARKQLAQWLEEGKIKRKMTVVEGGVPKAEHALLDLFEGKNTGKMMVEVKGSDEGSAKL